MKLAAAVYDGNSIRKPLVVNHIDDYAIMMTNTKQRILGIDNHIKKWLLSYFVFLGKHVVILRRYFILVIGGAIMYKV